MPHFLHPDDEPNRELIPDADAPRAAPAPAPVGFWDRYPVRRALGIIGVVGLMIAIGSFVFSYYATPSNEIAYGVKVDNTLVYDASSLSLDLVLSDTAGVPVRENLYVNETVFFNNGDTIVDTVQFITLPTISVSDDVKVMSVRISRVDSSLANAFTLRQDTTRQGTYTLSWTRFDPEAFVAVSIVYSANSPVNPVVSGESRTVQFRSVERGRLNLYSVMTRVKYVSSILLIIMIAYGYLVSAGKIGENRWRGEPYVKRDKYGGHMLVYRESAKFKMLVYSALATLMVMMISGSITTYIAIGPPSLP